MLVAVQLSVLGLYLPPVLKQCRHLFHPRRSFHCRSTLPCANIGAEGALIVVVAVHVSVLGLYLPPVFSSSFRNHKPSPPDDHFTAGPDCRVTTRAQWARCVVLVAVHVSVPGLYLPPLFNGIKLSPSHPRRSFHCRSRLPCESPDQWAHWRCWWLSNYRC